MGSGDSQEEESFYDYGNAPEVLIESKAVPHWELLECGLIRLFVCKKVNGRFVLDHTDLMSPSTMEAIGQRFMDIAGIAKKQARQTPTLVQSRAAH
jgi:hypothetical protein